MNGVKHVMHSATNSKDHLVETAKEKISSAVDSAEHAAKEQLSSVVEGAEHVAAGVRTSWMDGLKAAADIVKTIRGYSSDDVLNLMGLRRRESSMVRTGLFGMGLTLGMGAGMLLAPASGKETRRWLRARVSAAMSGVKSTAKLVADEIKDTASENAKKVEEIASAAKDMINEGGNIAKR